MESDMEIETDEWYNSSADLLSVCANSKQVLWEERQPDCNKQEGFNFVHEQTGYVQMDQDYTKQDGFTSECVKSEQTAYESMQQACLNSVCVNKNATANLNAYTEKDELHSVFGTTKQLLNPNTDQSYIITNDLNSVGGIAKQYIHTATDNRNIKTNDHTVVCGIVKQYINTDMDNGHTTANDHNSVCGIAKQYVNTDSDNRTENDPNASSDHSNAIEDQAQLAYVNSVFLTREEITFSNVDQYCVRPTVIGETIPKNLYSNLDVHNHSNFEKDDSENAENAVTTTVPLSLKPAKMKLNEKGDQVKKVKRMKKAKTPEKEKTEFSLQERNPASCMNLEPRDNDHFLYCGECNKEFEGDCPVHGPYNYIQDKEVPEGDPLQADHTVPDCLVIKTSKIAGLGVFAKDGLESRVMFGPYGGDIVAENQKSGYCWQTLKEGNPSHFVDAQNKATSNWMRYVNCAMTKAGQNLEAFQYRGGIYYCTLKPVSPGEELLVWYGDKFARELGVMKDKNVCIYSSKNSGHLKIQMRQHAGKRPYKCEECNYECYRSGHLKTHMRIHTGERPYTCEECNYACTQSGNLKIHMRIHTGERLYKCGVCGYACHQSGTLKIHMWIHTGERPYKCKMCDYACKDSGSLKRHMRIHTGERPYRCEVCGYECNSSEILKTHMRIHTEERPFKCEVCDYACKQSGHLKTHMWIHTGEKPYTCKMCDYACKQSGSLKRHMRIHTGERLYMCDVCVYECNSSEILKTHMRIHTGERPYKCEVCDYACKQSGHLKTHMRIHTGERPYKCGVCGYAGNRSDHLKKHMRIHTGETVQL
ncbi:hypothetical protein DPMN_126419 [Dreissena polymorpha]|uniref:Uncharacterized protein n=1 Tax=Dreissena polymorpha TaxID=45954 RepID=A0A9D4H3B4_DREPO|nr:hypothetical protein DPMN_126419 [Dreissena polymorpha]